MKNHQRRRLGLLGLIALTPLLLSATRDPKSPVTPYYEEISVAMTELPKESEEEQSTYEFIVKNDGDGYILPFFDLFGENENGDLFSIPGREPLVYPGVRALIGKGEQYALRWSGDTAFDFVKAKYHVTAYVEPSTYFSYQGSMSLSKMNIDNHYLVDCVMSFRMGNYKQEVLVKMEYEGQEYVFSTSGSNYEHKPMIRVESDAFDMEKAVIKSLIAFDIQVDEVRTPNYGGLVVGGTLYLLLIDLGIGIFIVLPAVLILVLIHRKRRKNQNKEQ